MNDFTTITCNCGNQLTVQSIAIHLGLVEDCGHCGVSYPREQHEAVLQQSIQELGEHELREMALDSLVATTEEYGLYD